MRIALIADIHANLPALEAVLAHAQQQEATKTWNLGDLVGYGAMPDEVVQRLRKSEVLSVVGNYDLKVLEFKEKGKKWQKKKHPEKYLAFEWTYQHLSKKNRQYLRFLSQELRLKVKGKRILLTHGSPASIDEPLAPDTPEERLRELAQEAKADLIITGHSHQPHVRQVGTVWFVNPGSVGRPDDGDPRASYAVLDIGTDSVAVQHFRVEYDVEAAATAIREQHLPETFAQMVLQGRSLNGLTGVDGESDAGLAQVAASPG